MMAMLRTLKWTVSNPEQYPCCKRIPKPLLDMMVAEKTQFHYHFWAVKSKCFYSCQPLVDFFEVIAIDDGLPQGLPAELCVGFEEFPVLI